MNKQLNVAGYNFIEVGEFRLSENPLPVTFNGKEDKVFVELDLYQDGYKEVGGSVYVVVVDRVVLYVGEFSTTLEDRWFRKTNFNYIWHGQDENIRKKLLELKNEQPRKKMLFYLIDDPFVMFNEKEINISKSIEHDILQSKEPGLEWNKKNRLVDAKKFKRMREFIGS